MNARSVPIMKICFGGRVGWHRCTQIVSDVQGGTSPQSLHQRRLPHKNKDYAVCAYVEGGEPALARSKARGGAAATTHASWMAGS